MFAELISEMVCSRGNEPHHSHQINETLHCYRFCCCYRRIVLSSQSCWSKKWLVLCRDSKKWDILLRKATCLQRKSLQCNRKWSRRKWKNGCWLWCLALEISESNQWVDWSYAWINWRECSEDYLSSLILSREAWCHCEVAESNTKPLVGKAGQHCGGWSISRLKTTIRNQFASSSHPGWRFWLACIEDHLTWDPGPEASGLKKGHKPS